MEKKVIVSTTRIEAFVEKSFSTIRNNCFFLSKTVSLYGETASSGKKIENGFTIRRNCFFWQKKVENGFTIWRNCFFWQKNQKWFLL